MGIKVLGSDKGSTTYRKADTGYYKGRTAKESILAPSRKRVKNAKGADQAQAIRKHGEHMKKFEAINKKHGISGTIRKHKKK